MKLPIPVVERITQDILRTLTGALGRDGYTVQRRSRLGRTPGPGMIVVDDTITATCEPAAQEAVAWAKRYAVSCYVIEPEGTNMDSGSIREGLVARVTWALRRDYTRGGLASDTEVLPAEAFDTSTDDQIDGVHVMFSVHYATDWNDPTILRMG